MLFATAHLFLARGNRTEERPWDLRRQKEGVRSSQNWVMGKN